MDFHDSLENYRRSVQKFLSGMNVIISADEPHLEELTADRHGSESTVITPANSCLREDSTERTRGPLWRL